MNTFVLFFRKLFHFWTQRQIEENPPTCVSFCSDLRPKRLLKQMDLGPVNGYPDLIAYLS